MDWLDQNLFGQLRADPQAHIANLANNVRLLGEQPDFLLFAKAHFPETMSDLWGRGKLLDPNRGASPHAAERANEWLRTFRIRFNLDGTVVHLRDHRMLIETELQE
jgi:hypothetical protein